MPGLFHVGFNISPVPGVLTDFVAQIVNTLNTAAVLDSIIIPAPHNTSQNVQFNNLDAGIYIVTIFDTPDHGVTLGNIRHNFWVDTLKNIITERRHYRVGGAGLHDPADQSTGIVDPYFDGKTITGVFIEAYRYLIDLIEWQQNVGGVLTFLNDVKLAQQITNSAGQIISVEIQFPSTASGGSDNSFTIFIAVNANKTLTPTDYGKIQLCAAAGNFTITSPFIGTIPDGIGFEVRNDAGGLNTIIWRCQAGEFFRFRGADKNYVFLGVGQSLRAIKAFGKLQLSTQSEGHWNRVGQIIFDTLQRDNTLIADGTLYTEADAPALYDWIDNECPMISKIGLVTWASDTIYQGLFGIDSVAHTFRVPNYLDLIVKSVRNIGGFDDLRTVNAPGWKQAAQVGEITVTIPKGNGYGGDTVTIRRMGPGAGDHVQPDDNFVVNTGKENLVKNIGALPLVLY